MNITITEINPLDSKALEHARAIYQNYFLDLYNDQTPDSLKITGQTMTYLQKIFNETEEQLLTKKLHGFFAKESDTVIIMVRHANEHHQQLCENAGFRKENSIFQNSDYIQKIYDPNCYYGYVKEFFR